MSISPHLASLSPALTEKFHQEGELYRAADLVSLKVGYVLTAPLCFGLGLFCWMKLPSPADLLLSAVFGLVGIALYLLLFYYGRRAKRPCYALHVQVMEVIHRETRHGEHQTYLRFEVLDGYQLNGPADVTPLRDYNGEVLERLLVAADIADKAQGYPQTFILCMPTGQVVAIAG